MGKLGQIVWFVEPAENLWEGQGCDGVLLITCYQTRQELVNLTEEQRRILLEDENTNDGERAAPFRLRRTKVEPPYKI